MRMSRRLWVLGVAVLSGLLFFCSKLVDDSTDLGSSIIQNIDSNKVSLNKHVREYVMDTSSAFRSDSSFPATSDTGFGVHSAAGSYMVLGTKGNERAAGWVQFIPAPDTGKTRIYAATDTLKSITLHFTRDTNPDHPNPSDPHPVQVWYSQIRSHTLNPSTANGDALLGIMTFQKDTAAVNVPDSIVLQPGTLTNTIFTACRDTIKDSTHLATRPVMGFIVATLNAADIIRLNGNMQLTVRYIQGSDTTTHYQTYYMTTTTYYLATDDNTPDSLLRMPALSYASKRTAVYHYSLAAFWDTINNMPNAQYAQVISAVFWLKRPKDTLGVGDTLTVQYLVCPVPVHNGTVLDSLFKANPSPPGAVSIIDTAALVQANVCQSLEWYMRNGRPSELYLYLRFTEDQKQRWKQTVWKTRPRLTAMISVP
jgi:hypothetical protein